MKDLLDCAELASKHESTRRLFGVMWDAAQAQRKVQLHMLVERFPERMVDIVRTRADEWDRMTVRLIEQEASRLTAEEESQHDGWAAIEARNKQAERTAERPKLSPLPPETYPGVLQAKRPYRRVEHENQNAARYLEQLNRPGSEPDAEHGTAGVWEYRAFECKQHATCPHFRPHKGSDEWNCVQCYVMRRGPASANAVEQEAR